MKLDLDTPCLDLDLLDSLDLDLAPSPLSSPSQVHGGDLIKPYPASTEVTVYQRTDSSSLGLALPSSLQITGNDVLTLPSSILSINTSSGFHTLSADARPFRSTYSFGPAILSANAKVFHASTFRYNYPVFETAFLCSDGGSRSYDIAASGWILYNAQWEIIAGNGTPLSHATNNDAELRAALDGLSFATSSLINNRIVHLTDSTLVSGAITGNIRLNSPSHQSVRSQILDLQGRRGNIILSFQVPREFNSGADRMCNTAMDASNIRLHLHLDPVDILNDQQATMSYVSRHISHRVMSYGEASLLIHNYRYKLVMIELIFMSYLPSDYRFTPPDGPSETKTSLEASFVTGFETDVSSPTLDGTERIIPASAIARIKHECISRNIPWHDSAFSKNAYLLDPVLDVTLLSSLCRAVGDDAAKVVSWFRDQTETDYRPNKHLRPLLYEKHLKLYPGLSDLCQVAREGFHSRVHNFNPPRPFPPNHLSALQRGPAVQRKLFKEAMRGRTLILHASTAARDLRINTCPYAVAEKKGIDYSVDGRLIHNASFPLGRSINDAVPSAKMDASTDDIKDLAHRVLYLYRYFPGVKIFGMVADVDAAFQNAHSHSASSLLFGGKIPDTDYVAIALTAIFGYKDSPAIFALLARAAQHYHRHGSSEIGNAPTPFHSWVWVDDFVGIEPDIDDRLSKSEQRLRSSFHLIFGSPGWNINKFAPWSNDLHAVGMNWNLMDGTISMPDDKILKTFRKVSSCLALIRQGVSPTLQVWRSLVGTLRHIGSCVPAAKPFYNSFVSMEKILVSHGTPDWSTLEWDLLWFLSILNKKNLNGITMERFVGCSDRTVTLFLSWTPTHTFIIDYRWKKALIVEDVNGSHGGLLLEYYLCTSLLIPFALGPFPRNDLQVTLICKTADAAHHVTNWKYKDYSLRQLGWLCTQQHVSLICTGPKNTNIDLSKFTNTFFQVLMEMPLVDIVTPLELPCVLELMPLKKPVSDLELAARTAANLNRGSNSAPYTISTKIDFIKNPSSAKTRFFGCLLRQVAWGLEVVKPSVQKHSAMSACLPSNRITKNASTTRSQWACVWKWAWKGIAARTPPPHLKNSPLVPTSCGFLDPNSWKKEAHSPLSCGAVPSWGSSPSAAQGKYGALSSQLMKITCSSGRTSHLDMVTPAKKRSTKKQDGSMCTSILIKATDTKKVVRFDWEGTTIRCYAQSEPFGGYRREETTSTSGIVPIAVYQKSRKEWSSTVRRSSTVLRRSRETTVWKPNVSLDTHYGSEGLRSLWRQALMKRSSSLWADGSRTATWPISGSTQI